MSLVSDDRPSLLGLAPDNSLNLPLSLNSHSISSPNPNPNPSLLPKTIISNPNPNPSRPSPTSTSNSPLKLKLSAKRWLSRNSHPDLFLNHLPLAPLPIPQLSSPPLHFSIPAPMADPSISATHSLDHSDRRPTRTRKPPEQYHGYIPFSEINSSKRRLKQGSLEIPQSDALGRTRSAKNILGQLEPSSSEFPPRPRPRLHNQINHSFASEDDKDADGEDDVGEDEDEDGDGDGDGDAVDDEDNDTNFNPTTQETDSDYRDVAGETSDQPAPSDESVPIQRQSKKLRLHVDSDDEAFQPTRSTRSKQPKRVRSIESPDPDLPSDDGDYNRPSSSKNSKLRNLARRRAAANGPPGPAPTRRSARRSTRFRAPNGDESDPIPPPEHVQEDDEGRQLRQRKNVDYHIPGLHAFELEGNNKAQKDRARAKRLPMNMSGKQLDQLFGQVRPGPDSDDEPAPAFGKATGPGILNGPAAGLFGSAMLDPGNLAAGGPSNMGKMSGATNLADTDPLGVQTNIDFSHVGGMDHHIQQLKEMVSLPLLYPEIFQRFQITPPRGVLFHGPPGTGKTLLARALAASCSSEGQKISFFMRKGADCLSKWVGEAERQLRLLFEEAKNCQPSIIFFDEIDGLAPVRSSKQEQIHASIVSTLLSLMDGMDGRGQVVIIGATNRPDAVDPALRRPGRFDREFYFPLPNREARLSILNIHTRGWDPPLSDSFKLELAELTKGYGGADLRALCTEAALNAVQRKYPQIYKSSDRLVIDPTKIDVVARDFTIAQKHLIPSTTRSSSNLASPLPGHMRPLLERPFEKAKEMLTNVLPEIKKPSVLEEAEYEEDPSDGFEKEKMIQSFETLRVFRPRLVVCGPKGSGQQYIGSAILHHLEGYHVQSLDLANLISDSTLSADARCVQIFAEAKRHKPSVLYIPSLHRWNSSTLASVKGTVSSLLDELKATEPVLLLAVVDCPFEVLPKDLRSWFGGRKANRLHLEKPWVKERAEFFKETVECLRKPPHEFPDGVPRRKRVLEELPKAPPRQPRMPTQSELLNQLAQDQKLVEYLKFRLGPVLNELKKKHKRFCKPIGSSDVLTQEANADESGTTGRLKFFNVDLESMHYKLYYNKYLTSQQFVADVEKIVYNAEQDCAQTGLADYDLAVKAQAMLTHTRIMVEQACDQQFDIDCQRMYERQKLRDGQASMEAQKAAAEKEKTGEGQGRQSGKEPESEHNPLLSERGLKRPMSGEERQSGSERPCKRSRAKGTSEAGSAEGDHAGCNGYDVDAAERPDMLAPEPSTTPDYEPGERPLASAGAHPASFPPPSLSSILNPDVPHMPVGQAQTDTSMQDESLAGQGSVVQPTKGVLPESTTPTDPPPAAPLQMMIHCPESSVSQVFETLIESSSMLVVEQLEQVRAGCLSIIWSSRKEFDKRKICDKVMDFMGNVLEEFVGDCEDESDEDDGLDEGMFEGGIDGEILEEGQEEGEEVEEGEDIAGQSSRHDSHSRIIQRGGNNFITGKNSSSISSNHHQPYNNHKDRKADYHYKKASMGNIGDGRDRDRERNWKEIEHEREKGRVNGIGSCNLGGRVGL